MTSDSCKERRANSKPGAKDSSHQQDARARVVDTSPRAQYDDVILVPVRHSGPRITLKGFALLVVAFLIFKGAAIAWIGAEDYAASITYLQSGTIFERAAAFIMMPDAISQSLSNQIKFLLPGTAP